MSSLPTLNCIGYLLLPADINHVNTDFLVVSQFFDFTRVSQQPDLIPLGPKETGSSYYSRYPALHQLFRLTEDFFLPPKVQGSNLVVAMNEREQISCHLLGSCKLFELSDTEIRRNGGSPG